METGAAVDRYGFSFWRLNEIDVIGDQTNAKDVAWQEQVRRSDSDIVDKCAVLALKISDHELLVHRLDLAVSPTNHGRT